MPYLGAVQLATTTLGSSASSVTFSNIPTKLNGLYLRDLILVSSARHSSQSQPYNQLRYRYNGDSGANYNEVRMGDWSGTISNAASNQTEHFALYIAPSSSSNFAINTLQLFDFAATDKHKTGLFRSAGVSDTTAAMAGRWASTAAINSILVYTIDGNFVAGSTFNLYATVRKP